MGCDEVSGSRLPQFGQQSQAETIPHPSFQFRKFVLIPLAEIEPEFKIPKIGLSIKELIIQCPDKTNVRAHYMKSQA